MRLRLEPLGIKCRRGNRHPRSAARIKPASSCGTGLRLLSTPSMVAGRGVTCAQIFNSPPLSQSRGLLTGFGFYVGSPDSPLGKVGSGFFPRAEDVDDLSNSAFSSEGGRTCREYRTCGQKSRSGTNLSVALGVADPSFGESHARQTRSARHTRLCGLQSPPVSRALAAGHRYWPRRCSPGRRSAKRKRDCSAFSRTTACVVSTRVPRPNRTRVAVTSSALASIPPCTEVFAAGSRARMQ